mgnify:CR=1 FL=1
MDKKCLKCRYRNKSRSGFLFCDYIGHTGHSRGCKADENCDKYEPKERKNVKKNKIL